MGNDGGGGVDESSTKELMMPNIALEDQRRCSWKDGCQVLYHEASKYLALVG